MLRSMQGERRVRRGLTRRDVLIGGGGARRRRGTRRRGHRLAVSGGSETVTFWHLFGGGDGERLTQILADIAPSTRTATSAS